ncbi:PaaI family thioesterase [Ktedonobacter robiniae]|uniref:Thioesterase domain-containing protein n=1 Tax=Ktedonobacter robiniae TaxID=2778365 RepID=A0ABQ3V053_9CHLR|nr:PaaI family thioesterase [Ktedonobacter robiniae]GHO58320.1 hypothetical protein KSB_67950 [Ktedonobacter robiniae]
MSTVNEQPARQQLTRAEVIRRFFPTSPYVGYLDMRIVEMGDGIATVELPYREELVTAESVVHGGAVASLIDVAGMVAAWASDDIPTNQRGSTVSLTVNYLAPAEKSNLLATARVLRRGRSLVYLDIEVANEAGNIVAKGLATYKLG